MKSSFRSVISLSRITALFLGVALCLSMFGTIALADFSGPFAPANWSLINDPANTGGTVIASAAQVVLTGGNNGSDTPGWTEYRITVPQNGTISFSWAYSSTDKPDFDRSGFCVNDNCTLLGDANGQSGSVPSVAVTAGNIFAFGVETDDGLFGAGVLTITNFNFTPATSSSTSVGGRVLDGLGRGLPGAVVTLSVGKDVRVARTSLFGYYSFDNIEIGSSITVRVGAKRFEYAPHETQVNAQINDLNFSPIP